MSSVKTPNASDPSNGGQSAGVPDVQGGPGGTQNKSDGEKYRREQCPFHFVFVLTAILTICTT